MILDKQNLCSDDQAVTVSAASTNVIDMGADAAEVMAFLEKAGELWAQVTTTFTGATSMKVAVQVDDAVGFGTAVTVQESEVILEASLVAGYQFRFAQLPPHLSKRYLRFYYTVDGTHGAGAISAGIVLDKQTNI